MLKHLQWSLFARVNSLFLGPCMIWTHPAFSASFPRSPLLKLPIVVSLVSSLSSKPLGLFNFGSLPYLGSPLISFQILCLLKAHLRFTPPTKPCLVTLSHWNLTLFEIPIALTFISHLTSKIPRLRLLIFCLV